MRSVVTALMMIVGSICGQEVLPEQVPARQNWGGNAGRVVPSNVAPLSPREILYVDNSAVLDPGPNDLTIGDPDEDGSLDHPFDSIQEAIDVAHDHVTIRVQEGRYVECLNFRGKSIKVIGFDPDNPTTGQFPIIDANNQGTTVTFDQREDANCLLSGFVLTRGNGGQAGAIACVLSSPTIRHCLIVGNRCSGPDPSEPSCGVIYGLRSRSLFENCTIADNYGGRHGSAICVTDCSMTLSNSIVWGNAPKQLRVMAGDAPTELASCLDADPLFALPGYWRDATDPNLTPVEPNDPNAIWLEGDYHLQSLHGRYDAHIGDWAYDDFTSDCIDLGDPSEPVGQETAPHGDRLNVGAYGGTWMASRTGKLVFVAISEPDFQGEMGKYEITNGQYCQYLNMALAEGLVELYNDRVYASLETGRSDLYFKTFAAFSASQIVFSQGQFTSRTRDGYHMANHPVVGVSFYGAAAFADYFGCRLPTSDQWQAVADYDGSFIYACGEEIDANMANYDNMNPLGLTSDPYTSPVGYYPAFGYGLCDLAGNVREWTDSVSGRYSLLRSGDWQSLDLFCTTSSKSGHFPSYILSTIGFRICR